MSILINSFQVLPPVSISDHPEDVQTTEGQTATFQVVAVNAISYQWQRRDTVTDGAWADISGATSASYTTPTLTAAGDSYYQYRCAVTGQMTVYSNPGTLIVTLTLYEEDFSVDRATIAASPTTYAAKVGTTKYWSPGAGTVSGGALHPVSSMFAMDASASRPKLQGRVYYWRWSSSSATWNGTLYCQLVGESGSNWWALQEQGDPATYFHNDKSLRGIGSKHDGGTYAQTDNNYQWRTFMESSKTYECITVDRGTGSFTFVRVDGGNWEFAWLEPLSDISSKQAFHFTGATVASCVAGAEHMATYNARFAPAPLVQHSFGSVISPSDGTGQTEVGGSGLVAVTSGSMQITSSKLEMAADGTGVVLFEAGEADIATFAEVVPVDGSPVGLIVRAVDANNYLVAEIDTSANTISWRQVVAGVETALVTQNTNSAPDFFDPASGSEVRFQAHAHGTLLRAAFTPSSLHTSHGQITSSQFQSATKVGVRVKKGSGVNSSSVQNFAAWAHVQSVPNF